MAEARHDDGVAVFKAMPASSKNWESARLASWSRSRCT